DPASSNLLGVYINGSLATSTASATPPVLSFSGLDIGVLQLSGVFSKLQIDEFRVAYAAPQADDETTEYNNQRPTGNVFWTQSAQRQITQDRTQTGVARIQKTSSHTQPGKSRIQIHTPQTQPGKSRVQVHTPRTQPGKAAIRKTTTQT